MTGHKLTKDDFLSQMKNVLCNDFFSRIPYKLTHNCIAFVASYTACWVVLQLAASMTEISCLQFPIRMPVTSATRRTAASKIWFRIKQTATKG